MDSLIIEKIKKELDNFELTPSVEKVGRVVRVGDGVAEIEGLEEAIMSEMVLFDDSGKKNLKEAMADTDVLYGLVLNLEEDAVKVVILGDVARIQEGMLVKSTGRVLSIPVGEELLGRVVNTLAEPLDGKGAIKTNTHVPNAK